MWHCGTYVSCAMRDEAEAVLNLTASMGDARDFLAYVKYMTDLRDASSEQSDEDAGSRWKMPVMDVLSLATLVAAGVFLGLLARLLAHLRGGLRPGRKVGLC